MLIVTRVIYSPIHHQTEFKVTTWDALGYYLYLPAHYIYHDEQKLAWFDSIDHRYQLSGGQFYQANKVKNGNYVFKYLKGVSHLQLPFFLVAHYYAEHSQYPPDGFSLPYQIAIALGSICYCLFSLFLLRKLLLYYYDDWAVAIALILLILASNAIQYISVDSAQSHPYLFPLYVVLLYATIEWHRKPSLIFAALIGLVIGTAVISRPTEGIMIFIPLLWQVQTWSDVKVKLKTLYALYVHVLIVLGALVLAILPQLLYWKRNAGSWIYDVGSKWDFLNPHFRVLFGWEKGWFIYTPVTLLFVMGFFFIRKKEFYKAILTACLLNLFIIISWHIWRYGASYSCRALMQSYPLFAFPLTALVQFVWTSKWKWLFVVLGLYLVGVNLFQIKQYNETILHYDDMNFAYYRSIYLNNHPSPLNMSLLDQPSVNMNKEDYHEQKIASAHGIALSDTIFHTTLPSHRGYHFLRFKLKTFIQSGIWNSYYTCTVHGMNYRYRLFNPLSREGQVNAYEFIIPIHDQGSPNTVTLVASGNADLHGHIASMDVWAYQKK